MFRSVGASGITYPTINILDSDADEYTALVLFIAAVTVYCVLGTIGKFNVLVTIVPLRVILLPLLKLIVRVDVSITPMIPRLNEEVIILLFESVAVNMIDEIDNPTVVNASREYPYAL